MASSKVGFISDAEMEQYEASATQKQKKTGFISDAEMDSLENKNKEPQDNRSFIETVGDAVNPKNYLKNAMAGLKAYDDTINAPVRKFITEKVTGDKMENAPTGSDQAKMMGVTDKTYGEVYGVPKYLGGGISPADVTGVALEVVQDPLLLASGALKGAQKIAKPIFGAAEELGTIAKQKMFGSQSQSANAAAESGAKATSYIQGGGSTVENSGKLFSIEAPKNLDELNQWQPKSIEAADIPGKARLQQIPTIVKDLETKPLNYHFNMMENPKAMKQMKLEFEVLPTKEAQKIASYNQQIVNESAQKIGGTINKISPVSYKNLSDAGEELISTVKNKYNADKDALGPVFEEIKKNSVPSTFDDNTKLIYSIADNTKLKNQIEFTKETGKFSLKKNTPRSGISDQEHNILSRVVDDLSDGMTFKEIQDTRSFLRKAIDPSNPAATEEISKVNSLLLDQLENMSSKYGTKVRDTFTSYAKNERARESIEKIIGGKIESLEQMYQANPDKVIKKVFSNPNYAKTVESYIGPEKMQEMVSSYVKSGIDAATDSAKGFNPSNFKTWMKSNKQFFTNYVTPEITERLSALSDYGYYGKRFLDEVNPAGTAASLAKIIKPEGFVQKISNQGIFGAVQAEAAGRVSAAVKQRQALRYFNEQLGGVNKNFSDNFKINLPSIPKVASEKVASASALSSVARGDIQIAQKSAEKEKNMKGPEKWASDGANKLNAHGELTPEEIEKLKQTKEGKEVLIKASDLESKSKAMDNLVKKIRTSSIERGQ